VSGINFKTPIIFLLSILIISICALPEYENALEGFISKPLYISSGFVTLLLSLTLLGMQAKGVKKGYKWLGEILSYAHGVFVTIIIALMVQKREFNVEGIIIIVLSTALIMLVASTIENKFEWIDKKFKEVTNTNAQKAAYKLVSATIIVLVILYIRYRAVGL